MKHWVVFQLLKDQSVTSHLKKVKSKIVQRSQGLASLNQFNSTNKIESILKKYPEADGWLPLTASVKDMVLLVNKKQESVISIVDLRPWK